VRFDEQQQPVAGQVGKGREIVENRGRGHLSVNPNIRIQRGHGHVNCGLRIADCGLRIDWGIPEKQ
jgi:hypothetical protein